MLTGVLVVAWEEGRLLSIVQIGIIYKKNPIVSQFSLALV